MRRLQRREQLNISVASSPCRVLWGDRTVNVYVYEQASLKEAEGHQRSFGWRDMEVGLVGVSPIGLPSRRENSGVATL